MLNWFKQAPKEATEAKTKLRETRLAIQEEISKLRQCMEENRSSRPVSSSVIPIRRN